VSHVMGYVFLFVHFVGRTLTIVVMRGVLGILKKDFIAV